MSDLFGNIDSQQVGVFIRVPIVEWERGSRINTKRVCPNKKLNDYFHDVGNGKFCQSCGAEIDIIEEVLSWRELPEEILSNIESFIESTKYQIIALGEDSEYEDDEEYTYDILVACYKTIGHRSDYRPFFDEIDINEIIADIQDIKEKHKDFIEANNAKVCFGIAGDHTDW